MPRVIAQNRIPRVNLVNRPMTYRPGDAVGVAPAATPGPSAGNTVWAAVAPTGYSNPFRLSEMDAGRYQQSGAWLPAVLTKINTTGFMTSGTSALSGQDFARTSFGLGGPNWTSYGPPAGSPSLFLTANNFHVLNAAWAGISTGAWGTVSGWSMADVGFPGDFDNRALGCTANGLWTADPLALLPAVQIFSAVPGGAAAYSQIRRNVKVGGNGNYVIWGTVIAAPPRFATALANLTGPLSTLCTVPVLNDAAGNPGHNFIVWIEFDGDKFVAATKYGEILTSDDGITFTKSFTKAAGGTSDFINYFYCLGQDRLAAYANPTANGALMVGSVSGAWVDRTSLIVIPAMTHGTVINGICGTWGCIGVTWDHTVTPPPTACVFAVSMDYGLTWVSGFNGNEGASGTILIKTCLASQGMLSVMGFGGGGAAVGRIFVREEMQLYRAMIPTVMAMDEVLLKPWNRLR